MKHLDHPSSLDFRPAEFFEQQSIELILGDPAVSIDRSERTILLRSGRTLGWSSLVLATGARVRELPCDGPSPEGLFYLRTLNDSLGLRARLLAANQVLAIGCGFIGLEAAAAARSLGKPVRIIGMEDRLMGRAVSPFISTWFEALHRRHGVDIQLRTAVSKLSAAGVHLENGTVESADAIVVGIGVLPNLELAAAAGLETANGIVADTYLRTSDPNIFAIGDCALHPNGFSGGVARIESIQNATDQARAVASTLTGKPRPFAQVPWFWTEQFEAKLQIAGLPGLVDNVEVRGDPDSGKFSVYSYCEGVLRTVESVNRPADHILARKALAEQLPTESPA